MNRCAALQVQQLPCPSSRQDIAGIILLSDNSVPATLKQLGSQAHRVSKRLFGSSKIKISTLRMALSQEPFPFVPEGFRGT